MARPPARNAGPYAAATAEAISVLLQRSGMTTKEFREAAGMSHAYYSSRMQGRYSFTLNDIEAVCTVLGVPELALATMAARLGELDPTPGSS